MKRGSPVRGQTSRGGRERGVSAPSGQTSWPSYGGVGWGRKWCSSNEDRCLEAGSLRQAQHDVHVLHGLAGGALAEVIEHGTDDGLAVLLVAEDVDLEAV